MKSLIKTLKAYIEYFAYPDQAELKKALWTIERERLWKERTK